MGRPTTEYRAGQRARLAAATVAPLGEPIVTGRCAHCKAPLVDADGNPSFDVLGAGPSLLCRDGCRG